MATEVILVTENDATGATTFEVVPVEESASADSITEIIEAIFDPTPEAVETSFTELSDSNIVPESTTFTAASPATESAATGAEPAPNTTTDAHASTATEAQAQADAAVARGDYEAAAHHREVAENAAGDGGDNSMLHGSNASELDSAHWQQQQGDYYEKQEAQHAQAGDYAAAKEDASNAAYYQGNADYNASGSDHTGQAKAEASQMDWAVWEEGNAGYHAQNAETYAAQGDFEHAAQAADSAAEHQATADYHGALGEHGGSMAVHDPASDVAHDTSYSSVDYSSASHDYSSASYDTASSPAE